MPFVKVWFYLGEHSVQKAVVVFSIGSDDALLGMDLNMHKFLIQLHEDQQVKEDPPNTIRFTRKQAVLLFDSKELSSFIYGRWNTETNPDLAFVKVTGHEPLPFRRIPDRFPRSHRPSLITTPSWSSPQRESWSGDRTSARPTGRTLGELSPW